MNYYDVQVWLDNNVNLKLSTKTLEINGVVHRRKSKTE